MRRGAWLKAKIEEGVFSCERTVTIDCADRRRQLIASDQCVDEARGAVEVTVVGMDEQANIAVVTLPVTTLDERTVVNVCLGDVEVVDGQKGAPSVQVDQERREVHVAGLPAGWSVFVDGECVVERVDAQKGE
jgi:hypothetical protein